MENLVLVCAECHQLVHSSKRVYQPLLQRYLEHRADGGARLLVPELARTLARSGELSELQLERLGIAA